MQVDQRSPKLPKSEPFKTAPNKYYNMYQLQVSNTYYLLKMIQKFWLVESDGWNRHIHSVVAQIWSYDIIIEYWKCIYDMM